MNNQYNDKTIAVVNSLAAASRTPFKTAFKITMGIALAQFLTMAMLLAGATIVFGTIGYLVTK